MEKLSRILFVLFGLLLITACAHAQDQNDYLPAFPGAEGYGAVSVGGRGGKVVKVTNLNPDGPGSLQAACATEGPVIVVFEVSGVIKPSNTRKGERWLSVKRSNITIAGQTAPGAGITIQGTISTGKSGGGTKAEPGKPVTDITMRFLRARPDFVRYGNLRMVELDYADRVIADHISGAWSSDDGFHVYSQKEGFLPHVTIQWCTAEEADIQLEGGDEPHNFGMLFAWGYRAVTAHHNLLAHHHNRAPMCGAYPVDFRNNVIYNAGSGIELCAHLHRMGRKDIDKCRVNVIGNYCKPGPGAIIAIRSYRPPCLHAGSNILPSKQGTYAILDNYMDRKGGYTEPWRATIRPSKALRLSDTPLDLGAVTTHTAEEAYELVCAHAGCLPRDAVSARTVCEVRTRTGSWGRNGPDGGLMEGLTPAKAPRDTDNDGIPDTWEKIHGLDPNDPADNSKIVPAGASPGDRHKGYTWIEYYINELADLKIAQALTQWRLERKKPKRWNKPANGLAPAAMQHKTLESMVAAIREQNAEKHKTRRTDTYAGWHAVQQFSRMGENARPAVPDLAKLVVGDDPRTVCFAAWGLGAIGTAAEEAIPSLITALKKDQPTESGKWKYRPYGFIAWALGRIGPAAKEAVPMLADLMHGKDALARGPAAWALAQIGSEARGATDALVKALAHNRGGAWGSSDTQVHAVRALANIGTPAVPALVKVCADTNAEMRCGAAKALGRMGPNAKPAVPALLKLTQDPNPLVRGFVAPALSRIDPGVTGVIPALAVLLTDNILSVRHSAVRALGECSGPAARSAVDALEKALEDKRPEVQRAALLSLGKIGKPAAGVLEKALSRKSVLVRKYAARALGDACKNTAGAVKALVRALGDKDAEVRREAVWSLGRLGSSTSELRNSLDKARTDDDYVIRVAAETILERTDSN